MPSGLCRDVERKSRRGGECWSSTPYWAEEGLAETLPPSSLFCGVVCSGDSRPFSSCVVVVSGNDAVQGGSFVLFFSSFLSLNLKGFI